MSIDALVSAGYTTGAIGVVVAIAGILLSLLTKTGPGTDLEIVKKNPLVRLSIGIIFLGGFILAIAIFIFLGVLGWWLFADVLQIDTPGQLAIYCLIFGPLPLVLPVSAEFAVRALGGNISARGRSECFLLGFNIGPLLENLLMAYLLLYLTGGLAVLGLLGSGIWWLFEALG